MSASKRHLVVLLSAVACLAAGCGSSKKIDLGGDCSLNSDCNNPLSCAFGKCHTACVQTRDCPLGQSCVMTVGGGVCQLASETLCNERTTCATGLLCAVDNRCRAACVTDGNCSKEQKCVDGVCADPGDVGPGGGLVPANPKTDAGVDATSCPTGSETCACYGNDTCNAGLVCASRICVRLSGTGGTGGSGGIIGGADTGIDVGREGGDSGGRAQDVGGGGGSSDSSQTVWNLAGDFLGAVLATSPTNPFSDSYGNPAVWHMMLSSGLVYAPSTYQEISTNSFRRDTCGCGSQSAVASGLRSWDTGCSSEITAAVWINIGPDSIAHFSCAPTAVWPPGKVIAHPGPKNLVIIAWRSPITGTASITGGFSDVDCNTASDGITWRVDSASAGANSSKLTTLASGSLPDCGSSPFPEGLTASVVSGDYLYFVVDPKSNYWNDSTVVDVTIRAR